MESRSCVEGGSWGLMYVVKPAPSIAIKANLMYGATFCHCATDAPPKHVSAVPAWHPKNLIRKATDEGWGSLNPHRVRVGVLCHNTSKPTKSSNAVCTLMETNRVIHFKSCLTLWSSEATAGQNSAHSRIQLSVASRDCFHPNRL